MERSNLKEKPRLLDRLSRLAAKYHGAAAFLAAFIMAGGSLMDYMRPFGLCYAMSLEEEDKLWGCGGAFVSYLMVYGREGILYSAAIILSLAFDAFLLEGKNGRELYLPPMLAAVVMVIKAPFAFVGGGGRLPLLIFEGFLTTGLCYCLMLPAESKVRTGVLAACFMTAFSDVKIFGLLSPSNAAGILMTMAVTYENRGFGGAALGLALGACMDMAMGGGPFFAAAFGLAAVISGLLPKNGRISFAMIHLLSGIACMVWGFGDPRAMGCIYDMFTAASVFLLLPDGVGSLDGEGSRLASEPSAEGVSQVLKDLGRAISSLSKSSAKRMEREGEEDICVVFDRASARLCRDCPSCEACWIENYRDTIGWLCDCLPTLKEKGHIGGDDLPSPFGSRCYKKERLCGEINREYAQYLRRRAERAEELGREALMKEQYDGLGLAVSGLAGAAVREHIPRPLAQKQVRRILKAYASGLTAEVFSSRGRLHMRVGVFEEAGEWVDEPSFVRSAEGALGISFLPAETIQYKSGQALLYREKETLSALISTCVRKKEGESCCGDSAINFKTTDGREIVMISDGMGTGAEAAELSKSALEPVAAFIKSGCTATESVAAVMPFLKSGWGARGFATLDILEIELFTGSCRIIKRGAAESYLIREGEVTAYSRPSLPPGLGGEEPEPVDLFVRKGDTLVMISDGVEIADPKSLTKKGLTAADVVAMSAGEGRDDMTAVVISIE